MGAAASPCIRLRRDSLDEARIVSGFFHQFDAFLATSQTSANADRLNARFAAIVEHSRTALAGKRVLDIASHDGRWSFAALQAGCSHVVGIEPRADLVRNARATFVRYGVASDRYEFLQADAFDALRPANVKVDTVLCLGFFYHTVRHVELVDLISRTGAQCVIIDTEIVPRAQTTDWETIAPDDRRVFGNGLAIELFKEPVDHESMALGDSATRDGRAIVGRPSREALFFIMQHFGFEVEEYVWPTLLRSLSPDCVRQGLMDYSQGWRSTFHCWRR